MSHTVAGRVGALVAAVCIGISGCDWFCSRLCPVTPSGEPALLSIDLVPSRVHATPGAEFRIDAVVENAEGKVLRNVSVEYSSSSNLVGLRPDRRRPGALVTVSQQASEMDVVITAEVQDANLTARADLFIHESATPSTATDVVAYGHTPSWPLNVLLLHADRVGDPAECAGGRHPIAFTERAAVGNVISSQCDQVTLLSYLRDVVWHEFPPSADPWTPGYDVDDESAPQHPWYVPVSIYVAVTGESRWWEGITFDEADVFLFEENDAAVAQVAGDLTLANMLFERNGAGFRIYPRRVVSARTEYDGPGNGAVKPDGNEGFETDLPDVGGWHDCTHNQNSWYTSGSINIIYVDTLIAGVHGWQCDTEDGTVLYLANDHYTDNTLAHELGHALLGFRHAEWIPGLSHPAINIMSGRIHNPETEVQPWRFTVGQVVWMNFDHKSWFHHPKNGTQRQLPTRLCAGDPVCPTMDVDP